MTYYLTVATSIAIVLIGVLGTHLITGMNGLFSLGQAAFMGLGVYTSAILVVTLNVPFPIAVVISIVFTVLVAFLVGFATLRISTGLLCFGDLWIRPGDDRVVH